MKRVTPAYAAKLLLGSFASTSAEVDGDDIAFGICQFACFYVEQHHDTQFASVFALSNPNRPHKAGLQAQSICPEGSLTGVWCGVRF